MVVPNPPDVLRDVASDAARAFLKDLLPRVLSKLQGAWPLKRHRLLRKLPAKLRDCVADLRPCFALSGSTFNYVIFNLGLPQNDEWRSVSSRVSMVAAWFEGWDEMQQAVGERVTPEFFVKGLENLNRLLFWTSHVGEELSKLVDQTPESDPIRKPMHALADRYNNFLTNYEGFLRRLPSDLNIRPLAPVRGMEAFFGRLRDPWSSARGEHTETVTDWIETCDHDIAEEARDILSDVLREMDLLSDPIAIPAHGPTEGGHRLPPDRKERLVRFRERVANMLVSRQSLKAAQHYDYDPDADRRDGFVIIADREPVQQTLNALNDRLSH